VPLAADEKELPDADDLVMLETEVAALVGYLSPNSAGGISA
jgi:hypothetical protein